LLGPTRKIFLVSNKSFLRFIFIPISIRVFAAIYCDDPVIFIVDVAGVRWVVIATLGVADPKKLFTTVDEIILVW